jgi:hypothetical protein
MWKSFHKATKSRKVTTRCMLLFACTTAFGFIAALQGKEGSLQTGLCLAAAGCSLFLIIVSFMYWIEADQP